MVRMYREPGLVNGPAESFMSVSRKNVPPTKNDPS